MAVEHYFRINSPKIVHEIVDGEAVIINMDLGYYYSADKTGAFIWEQISNGASDREVCRSVAGRYEGEGGQIEGAVRQFLAELLREDLIVTATAPVPVEGRGPEGTETEGSDKPLFVPPTLNKYTDMEYLLLLDPIHEVDESGWPNTITDTKTP